MAYIPNAERYTQMEYRRCGRSGLKLPLLSMGLWHNFGDTNSLEHMAQLCETAFDGGITHFDLANNYGPPAGAAERNFGKLLKTIFAGHRDELVVSTKAGYDMWEGPYGEWGSRKYLLASLDQSLQRLGLDYVDIFYHHRPDPETPLEETMGALAQAVQSGKALYVGLSNYDGETMSRAAAILEQLHCPFIINQNRYSILDRVSEKNGILSASEQLQKGVIIYSPLAQGMLTERYLHGIPEDSRIRTDGRFLQESQLTEERLSQLRQLQAIAQGRGQTLAQLALCWILRQKAVTSVLVGASRPEQLIDTLQIVGQEPAVERIQDPLFIRAPHGSDQAALRAVSGHTVNDQLARQHAQAVFQYGQIRIQRHGFEVSGGVVLSKVCPGQNVQQMELDAVRAALTDVACGLHHHLRCFAGKSKDHMRDHMDIQRLELPDGIVKHGKGIAAPDIPRSGCVDRL